jgi:C4-dicarboxylate-specific signal transduction histidine kinase/FixJ family two-component response regulator
MTEHRILLAGKARSLARELLAYGNVVHCVADNRGIFAGLASATWDGCVLDAQQLVDEGFALVRQAREVQPNLALLVGGGETHQLEALAVASGVDDLIVPDLEGRSVARRTAHAVTFRRAKANARVRAAQGQVLVVEWDPVEAPAVRAALTQHGFAVSQAISPWQALCQLRLIEVHVLLTPPSLQEGAQGGVVDAALRYDPRLRVVVTSDLPDLTDAATAVAAGAHDYLLRPIGPEQALGAVQAAWDGYLTTSPSGDPERQGLRVLLIEPRAVTARLLEQVLCQERGVQVITVGDLATAALRLQQQDIDAVLCSPDRDRSDALDVIHQLRRIDERPAVLILVDERDAVLHDRALRFGAQDVIVRRAVGREAVGSRVRHAVKRHQHRLQHQRFVVDLQMREASQQEVVRRSVDGLAIVDARGVVVFANPAAERMFAARGAGLVGSRFAYERFESGAREIQLGSEEEPRFAEMTCVAIDWNGARAELVAVRDITERRQTQSLRDRLAHSERLAAIGQLAAGVTHEINNPAAFVVANLHSMQRALNELHCSHGADPAVARATHAINEMIEENLDGMARIRSITTDLRTFARIDSSELSAVDVNACVRTACRIAFNEIRHRARLVEELSDTATVIGCAGKIAQVITNLLINAAQAIPEGHAEAHRITVRTGSSDEGVWFQVEDTGHGIPAAILNKLFDPFFTTKARSQGTGLGLALCADIVRQHGGEIRARNLTTGGALFEVSLPLHSELESRWSAVRVQPLRPAPEITRALRVLIVDDEILLLRSLRRMLSAHNVTTAASGAEALQRLRHEPAYDLILCDLMMPEIDGPALYAELERTQPELVQRFVFYSGGAFTPRTKAFVEQTQCPLLEKPLSVEAFTRVAFEICGEHPPVDAPVSGPPAPVPGDPLLRAVGHG